MKRPFHWRWALVLPVAAAGAIFLGACESKVSAENYAKVKLNMSLAQVEQILGSGTEDSQAGGRSIDAAGLMSPSSQPQDKVYVWKDGGKKIVVTFVKDRAVGMTQEGL